MRVIVKKWGNSAAVRIPAAIMSMASVEIDQPVEVREEDGRSVIEPIQAPRYDVEVMVASIADDQLHDLIDFGPSVGSDVW